MGRRRITRVPRTRSKFTKEEDTQLVELIRAYGESDWVTIASHLPGRNSRQCRERWRHYLMPSLATNPFTNQELLAIVGYYREHGPKWKLIASHFEGRTHIAVKNAWVHLVNKRARNQARDAAFWNWICEPVPDNPNEDSALEIDWSFSLDEDPGYSPQRLLDLEIGFSLD
jgi:hypothetical protein